LLEFMHFVWHYLTLIVNSDSDAEFG